MVTPDLPAVLAIDGGNSKTDVALVAADGSLLATAAPGGTNWGIGVTCGAGINCVGVDPAGRTTGYLALGDISGDWGGGAGLGQAALWRAARAEDGRGPQTSLREAVASYFGVPTVRDVTLGIHLGKIGKKELLGLAPVLLAMARAGDQVARDLVRRQAEEICVMAVTAMRRLGLTTRATPVVLGGGLMTARDPLLLQEITDRITAAAPQATVIVVAVPPVAGAALLGLDHVGAGADAERRLRAAYEGWAWS
jgi:N-acetylglucosamine kinase-like BadF-type ATPase